MVDLICDGCCQVDQDANDLMEKLTTDVSIEFPTIDLDDDIFKLPGGADGPIYQPVPRLNNEDLTTREVGGQGVFDALMASVSAHISAEFEKGRITAAEFTRAYIELTSAAMGNAVAFLLGKDQAYWSAQLAQVQAITARVELEATKVRLAAVQLEAYRTKADYALAKVNVAKGRVDYCAGKFNLDIMLPIAKTTAEKQLEVVSKQIEMTDAQIIGVARDNSIKEYQLSDLLPTEKAQTIAQTTLITTQKLGVEKEIELSSNELIVLRPLQAAGLTADNLTKTYTNANILPKQATQLEREIEMLNAQVLGQVLVNEGREYTNSLDMPIATSIARNQLDQGIEELKTKTFTNTSIAPAQHILLKEQGEAARAQTINTRSDGTVVVGVLGKQKDLYTQQVTSYQRDAELKAARVFSDAWITQKTIDEDLLPPNGFTNANIDQVLTTIKTKNGL